MILAAITRWAGSEIHGNFDPTWVLLWEFIEACIAIIMASMTALRVIFIQGDSKAPDKKTKTLLPLIRKGVPRKSGGCKKSQWEEVEGEYLPEIPSTTFTGIRTVIHQNGRSAETCVVATSEKKQRSQESSHPPEPTNANHIYVTHRMEIHSDRVSPELPSKVTFKFGQTPHAPSNSLNSK
ncbi:hypothetical protein MMC29_005422 [Sticta canariensis]|nr:hypothetical protein [Sticta canariensis]